LVVCAAGFCYLAWLFQQEITNGYVQFLGLSTASQRLSYVLGAASLASLVGGLGCFISGVRERGQGINQP
jgi:hypothetical protein